jgi:5-methylcytosine-specific restriction endonuclease McrA
VPYKAPIHKPFVWSSPRAQRERKIANKDAYYHTPEWRQVRRIVLQRDGHACQVHEIGCDLVANTVDHIIERSDGGSDDPSNLRACCRPCHNRRHPEKGRRDY